MDIQEIQEKFEDLLLANPDFDESLLGKDEEGCYSDSDIQHMYSMFEAGTEVREQWQSAKAQAVPEGYVLIKDDTKTVVAIERMVEQQVEASGMDSRRLERLDGWKIIEAAVKAQEPAND